MSTNTSGDGEQLEVLHFHRTCQNCGKNWWGLHCPHDGYQNPCPECGYKPIVLNDHYCDCEFVAPVSEIEAHTRQQVQKAQLEVVKEISEDSKYAEDRHAREVQQRLDDKAYFLMSDLKQEYKEES